MIIIKKLDNAENIQGQVAKNKWESGFTWETDKE